MKRFFAIILALILILSMTACTDKAHRAGFDEIVYAGEFTITKLEPYHNVPNGWSYLMCAKSGDVGVLLKVTPHVYLKYEIGDIIDGKVKGPTNNIYSFKFDESEWIRTITTIGLED